MNCFIPNKLLTLTQSVCNGAALTHEQALWLAALCAPEDIQFLLSCANLVRQQFKGSAIDLCGVINAKSGRCNQDCRFCSQSVHHHSECVEFPLESVGGIVKGAQRAHQDGAGWFGIVTSGKGIEGEEELEQICKAIRCVKRDVPIDRCASLGIITEEQAVRLKQAGLTSYHHNLETAESFFSQVCTTHSYEERINTVRSAKRAGLRVCCGGIFGIGETWEQRVEFVFTLRDLAVDMVPLNFLYPVKGTPLEHASPMKPLEILKTIALFRFVLPKQDIRICGGREVNLRTLQPLMFVAGANGSMVGNYLTTQGRNPEIDIQEIQDLGLTTKKGRNSGEQENRPQYRQKANPRRHPELDSGSSFLNCDVASGWEGLGEGDNYNVHTNKTSQTHYHPKRPGPGPGCFFRRGGQYLSAGCGPRGPG